MGNGLPKRTSMRLQTFDYGTAGAYFVTICTKDRECILSQVTNEPPFLNLSQYGEIVEVWISKIEQKYSEIKVDRYVIMPDHIHLLLFVMRDTEKQYHVPVVESVIGWFKYQVSKEINRMRGSAGEKFFQRSFYDHVVRDREDYVNICKYIQQNPLKWNCKT